MTTSIKSQFNKLENKTNKYYETYNHSTQMQDANNRRDYRDTTLRILCLIFM